MLTEQEYIEQLQGAFGEYGTRSEKASKDLANSAELLNKAIKAMESSLSFQSKEMQKIYKGALSKDTAYEKAKQELLDAKIQSKKTLDTLQKAVHTYEEAAKTEKDEATKSLLNEKKDFAQKLLNEQKLYDAKLQALKEEDAYKRQQINNLQRTALNLITNVANSIVKEFTSVFTSAYDSVSSTYESTYGTITSYNAYSKSDYNAVIDSLQKFIDTKGLSSVVSVKDYMTEITGVLQGGLTKELATTVAKYSVLSKEGGISADFTDTDFLKMVQKISDAGGDVESFLSNMMTQSKAVIDEVGNSFGFANGQINTMAESLYKLADVTNMSDEALSKSTAAMTAFSGVLGKTDLDTNKIFNMITEYATTGLVGSSSQAKLAFGMTSSEMQNLINTEGIGAALTESMDFIYSQYAQKPGEFTATLTSALGGELSATEITSLLGAYSSKEEFMQAYQDAFEAANKSSEDLYLDKLEDYQTQQEALTNVAENGVTDIVQVAKTNGIVVEKGLNTIIGLLGSQTLFGSDGIVGTIKNIKSSGVLDKTLAETLTKNPNLQTMLGNTKLGGAQLSKILSSAAGVAGIATGVITQGTSAYSAYKTSKQYGGDTSDAILAGAGGFLTGYTGFGESSDVKLQKAKSGRSFDWSSMIKTAGAGAAIGSGLGTLGVGPLGTIGGGVIGAIVGGATNAITQAVDMKVYKDYTKSDFYTALSGMDELFGNVADNAEKLAEANESFDEYNDLVSKRDKLLSSGKKVEDSELAILNLQIDAKKRLIDLQLQEIANDTESADKLEETAQATKKAAILDDLFGKVDEISGTDFTDASKGSDVLAALGGKSTIDTLISEGIIDVDTEALEQGFSSYEDVALAVAQLASGTGAGMVTNTNTGGLSLIATKEGLNKASASDRSNITKQLTEGLTEAQSTFNTNMSVLSSSDASNYAAIQNVLAQTYKAFKIMKSAEGVIDETAMAEEFTSMYPSIGSVLSSASAENLEGYKAYIDSNSIALSNEPAGYFKSGLNYVPYDGFRAVLHKGERVQTAAEATAQRLSTTSQNSAMSTSLVSALQSQTTEIVSILTKIYDAITGSNTSSELTKSINYKLISNA